MYLWVVLLEINYLYIFLDEKEKKEESKKVPEPTFEMLNNPARVMKQQLNLLSMPEGCKYQPVKDMKIGKANKTL